MTPAEAKVLRGQIAERWPEARDLEVSAQKDGALISMVIDGRIQRMSVGDGRGPLLEFLLSRPKAAGAAASVDADPE